MTEGDYKIPLNPIKLKNKFYGTTAKRGRQVEGSPLDFAREGNE